MKVCSIQSEKLLGKNICKVFSAHLSAILLFFLQTSLGQAFIEAPSLAEMVKDAEMLLRVEPVRLEKIGGPETHKGYSRYKATLEIIHRIKGNPKGKFVEVYFMPNAEAPGFKLGRQGLIFMRIHGDGTLGIINGIAGYLNIFRETVKPHFIFQGGVV